MKGKESIRIISAWGAALRRAAARARKIAGETRTPFIVYENGRENHVFRGRISACHGVKRANEKN